MTSATGFDHQKYVPVIITKRGEFTALRELPAANKQDIIPLFVVPPIDWDYDSDQPSKSVDQHLTTRPNEIDSAWGPASAFIDLGLLDDDLMANGLHPLVDFTDRSKHLGLALTPVASLDRSAPYLRATADVVARDRRGVCASHT